jgi:uncharacterized protein involved in exopolysaccharide biosynthesis
VIAVIYIKVKIPVRNIVAQVTLRQDDALGGAPSSSSSLLSAFGMGGGNAINIEDETLKMSSEGYIKNVVKNLNLNKVYTQTKCMGLVKNQLYNASPVVLKTDPALADSIPSSILFSLKIKPEKTTVKIKMGNISLGKHEITSFPATIQTAYGNFTFEKSIYFEACDKPFNLKILYTNYDYMTQFYRKRVVIDFEKKTSSLINLEMNSENVGVAKQILSEVIDVYNMEWIKDKHYVHEKTLGFINQRLDLVKNDLSAADRDIREFKEKYNLTDIEADVSYYMTLAGEVQTSLLEAETQLKLVDIIRDYINDEKNKYNLIPFSLTTADPSISEIIKAYNEQLIKRNEFYISNQQGAFVQSIDNSIELQRKNLLQSLNNVYKGLQITVQSIKGKESDLTKLMKNVPTVEHDFIHLKREQELQQTVYIYLLEKKEETEISYATWMPKLKIVDEPYLINKPVEPNMIKVALTVLFMGGFIIPFSLIYGIPYLRRKKD